MRRITIADLDNAKERCIELKKSNNRIVLNGNSSILLTTTLLEPGNEPANTFEIDGFRLPIVENLLDTSYLDALIFILNENYGFSGVIDYLPIGQTIVEINKQLGFRKNYADERIRKYILENDIGAIFTFNNSYNINAEAIGISEKMSSYNLYSLSGISTELSKKLVNSGIENHMYYGDSFGKKDFRSFGYDYVEDILSFRDEFKIGDIWKCNISRNKIWPMSVVLDFDNRMNYQTYNEMITVLIEFFSLIDETLKEKNSTLLKNKEYVKK